MNFLPLWTARVWPTNSGAIVERRDHVLRTFFWRERFISSMRPSSVSSMYGPFLSERPIPGSYFFRRVTKGPYIDETLLGRIEEMNRDRKSTRLNSSHLVI